MVSEILLIVSGTYKFNLNEYAGIQTQAGNVEHTTCLMQDAHAFYIDLCWFGVMYDYLCTSRVSQWDMNKTVQ